MADVDLSHPEGTLPPAIHTDPNHAHGTPMTKGGDEQFDRGPDLLAVELGGEKPVDAHVPDGVLPPSYHTDRNHVPGPVATKADPDPTFDRGPDLVAVEFTADGPAKAEKANEAGKSAKNPGK